MFRVQRLGVRSEGLGFRGFCFPKAFIGAWQGIRQCIYIYIYVFPM